MVMCGMADDCAVDTGICAPKACTEGYECRTHLCCATSSTCVECKNDLNIEECSGCSITKYGDDEEWVCQTDGTCMLTVEDQGLGAGAIASIIIFVVVVIAAIVIISYCCCCKYPPGG